MKNIGIKTFAYAGAAEKIHLDALSSLQLLTGLELDTEAGHPHILYFLTGGAEAEAVRFLDRTQFQLLIAGGKSNAFASAMEVKAYSWQNGYKNALLALDDGEDRATFKSYFSALSGLERLKGRRLGLIGEASEWLVSSGIPENVLLDRLGIEVVKISWSVAGDYRDHHADDDFLSKFRSGKQYNLEDAARVNKLLQKVIEDHKLDALTVECFSLVKEHHVTACLGLSFLNDLGIPAGCEGDLCSIAGMMISGEVLGQIPWMANVAAINGNVVLLAHCTAPASMLSGFMINTHFETGEGTAVSGRFNAEEVTVFRLNSKLDDIFFARGMVTPGPYEKKACRTQMRVVFDDAVIRELKSHPLGNHHLVLAGDRRPELAAFKKIFSSGAFQGAGQ